jgi:transcriptional regulator with XRE-family HTH domain
MMLKDYLRVYNISQKDFSKLVDISKSALSNYIRGIREPKLEIALRIVKVTKGKVSLKELLFIDNKGS